MPTKRDDAVTGQSEALYFIAAYPRLRGCPLTPINSDVDVLNFALTLEYLESTYYSKAMQKYSQKDFIDAGFPDWTRDRFTQIAAHEKTHVEFVCLFLDLTSL